MSKTNNRYHIVWTTKYRKPLITHTMADTLFHILQEKSQELGVEIINIAILPDHVHVVARIPASISVATVVKHWKGASSRLLQLRFEGHCKLWCVERNLWARRYFSCSVGTTAMRSVQAYVNNQSNHH